MCCLLISEGPIPAFALGPKFLKFATEFYLWNLRKSLFFHHEDNISNNSVVETNYRSSLRHWDCRGKKSDAHKTRQEWQVSNKHRQMNVNPHPPHPPMSAICTLCSQCYWAAHKEAFTFTHSFQTWPYINALRHMCFHSHHVKMSLPSLWPLQHVATGSLP